jgi:hypothetical protein
MSVTGITREASAGVATSSPSTALSTEIAGVRAPSAYSSADPKMPSTIMMRRGERPRASRVPLTSAIRASTPPSPLLSARMITTWYLIVTTRISDQNTSERTPSTLPGLTAIPWVP